jgi:hypothetical protein
MAMHLEALNHCPTMRQTICQRAEGAGLMHKLRISDNGAILQLLYLFISRVVRWGSGAAPSSRIFFVALHRRQRRFLGG